ncbi:MAG: hypothetical protein GEV05_13380 [Betaproteobacteria bacterium]|nr:hypothetical protein [Betaproteobacteria bacterium]
MERARPRVHPTDRPQVDRHSGELGDVRANPGLQRARRPDGALRRADERHHQARLGAGGFQHDLRPRGETEMAIQQINVSKPVAGTDYVGDLPGELHEYVVFAIAVMAVSREQEAARELIRFVTSPQAVPLLQQGMMEPASG